jgi:hypothetical protein
MIFAPIGMCDWTFADSSIGQRYLSYLSRQAKEQKVWSVGICGRSRSVQEAADDLLYLDNIARVRGKTRLSGTFRFYQRPALEGEESTRNYLAGTKLRITGVNKSFELTTNHDGVYQIYDLPPGKYVIEPAIPDAWQIDHSNGGSYRRDSTETDKDALKRNKFVVLLEEGKHAFVNFDCGVKNEIRGKVFDTAGNGMKDVCLTLVPARGKPSRYFYKADCTDKGGEYAIAGIPSGSYVLAVNKEGKISSRSPFQTFYYPNVSERERAAVISIGPGQMLNGIDIFVPRMEETITIDGALLHSDGKPVIQEWVQFEPEKAGDGIDGKARAQTDSKGRFTITILKGLKGSLFGQLFTYSDQYEHCPQLEELIKQGGRTGATVQTRSVEVVADDNITGVELRYAFPDCKKAK